MPNVLRFWHWPPRLLYGLLYLGAIFAFAAAYYRMPGQFYHSTIEREASMREDAATIIHDLSRSMIEIYKGNNNGSAAFRSEDWVANVEDLKLLSVVCKDRVFRFTVAFLAAPSSENPKDDHLSRLNGELRVINAILEVRLVNPRRDSDTNLNEDYPVIEAILFNPPMAERKWKWLIEHRLDRNPKSGLLLGLGTLRQMAAYANAIDGFPGRASSSFWRMFYLSAVTITTLGYGDIVPITTTARILVATEAIVGTVIIGLYLWSLTNQLGHHKPASRLSQTGSGAEAQHSP
jgi:Ion channel